MPEACQLYSQRPDETGIAEDLLHTGAIRFSHIGPVYLDDPIRIPVSALLVWRITMTRFIRPVALFFLILSAVGAAADLTLELANNAVNYMEWLLDVTFTAEQSQRYQQILAETWRGRNQGAKDGVISMAKGMEKIRSMGESEQAAVRAKVQPDFLRLLEKANDSDSRWILSIYQAAHNGASRAVSAPVAVG